MGSTQEKKLIGQILQKQGTVTADDVESALEAQKLRRDRKKPLASLLLSMGVLTETDALRGLSEQFGVPGIDLTQVAILLTHLDLVPREVAIASRILPVLAREDRLFLAIADPHDRRVIDELEFVTGRKIYPYVAIQSTLDRATAAAYDAKEQGETYYLAPNVPDATLVQLGLRHPAAAPAPPVAIADTAPRPASIDRPAIDKTIQSPSIDKAVDKTMQSASMPAVDSQGGKPGRAGPAKNLATPLDVNSRETVRPKNAAPVGDSASALDLEETREAKASKGPGRLVLVVDDEEEIRKVLRELIEERGHRVVDTGSGLTALQMVKDHSPDLVIVDAMLPDLHGFDIARRLKGSEKYGGIPIVMVSGVYKGWRIAEDMKTNYGIEEYIEKPFRIDDVTEILSRLLSRKEGETARRHPDHISSDADKLLQQGVLAYKAGDTQGAIEALKKGIEIDPHAYRLRYHLALLYGQRGQIYDGIGELERAVELNPRHFPALKNLAILYEKAGFKNKAVEMWERCVHAATEVETRLSIKEHLLTLL